ncbi:MAG TPA: trypsin-like peptidase domain-containing protein [Candidatus Nitrosotalea sp.]|nr:trypsin-like peptidase domain-containing protein [Candidatus Nitrosotalea sp.]
MDKTSIVLGGIYCTIVLVLILVFVISPIKSDVSNQLTQPNPFDQVIMKNTQLSVADLFAKSDQGVVQIIVSKTNDSSVVKEIGSGIVYDSTGHIITNNHVVENSFKITAVFHDGQSLPAKVVGTDPYSDLAVIKVEPNSYVLYPLQLGDSSELRIGDQVAAIGNPFGLTGSLTSGIVSQLGRLLDPPNSSFSIPNVIQTDTPINPGNSGGPLLNMQGKVIGINTAIQSETGEFSGVGFAIPSNTMKRIVPVLIKTGHYDHPWLGITGISVDPDLSSTLKLPVSFGFLINTVVPNSSASQAGLHGYKEIKTINGTQYKIGGDIIIAADEYPIKKINDLLNYLQDKKSVGDKMVLTVIRDGKTMQIALTLQQRPNQF